MDSIELVIGFLDVGSHPVRLLLGNSLGVSDTINLTINVEDTTLPTVLTCPVDTVISSGIPYVYDLPTAEDTCGILSIERTSGLASGDIFPIGITTVEHTISDANGNVSICSFDVEVISSCAPRDSLALIALYNATDGPNWNTTWDLSMPYSTWFGVSLNDEGCVVSLGLESNGLNGTLAPEIGELSELELFSIFNNDVGGMLPIELGGLSNMGALNLGSNQFIGAIPDFFDKWTSITTMTFDDNNFTGTIPPSIGAATTLTGFGFAGNNMDGDLSLIHI